MSAAGSGLWLKVVKMTAASKPARRRRSIIWISMALSLGRSTGLHPGRIVNDGLIHFRDERCNTGSRL